MVDPGYEAIMEPKSLCSWRGLLPGAQASVNDVWLLGEQC